MNTIIELKDRSLLAITGADRVAFLQNILTNDVTRLDETGVQYNYLLTPQGKYLHDFILVGEGETIWLDAASERMADIERRLGMYKLRSNVTLTRRDEMAVVALLDGGDVSGAICYADPRSAALGSRAIITKVAWQEIAQQYQTGTMDAYHTRRIKACVPDSVLDMPSGEFFPLHYNMEELHGVDFHKGCYVGQEVTARTKHRGVVRKKLFTLEGADALQPGQAVMMGESKAGQTLSAQGTVALALLEVTAALSAMKNEASLSVSGGAVTIINGPDQKNLEAGLEASIAAKANPL